MSFSILAKLAVGAAITKAFLDSLIDNDNSLNTRLALLEGAGVVNGSFDEDSDSDDIPDGWTADESGGGTVSLSTTTYQHGGQALQITLASTDQYAVVQSGEDADVADYVPTTPGERIELLARVKRSAASIPIKAWLRWYDASGTQVGADVSVYDDSGTGTAWAVARGQAVCPAGAYYYRLKLQGGHTTSPMGSVYWDGVQTRVFHGLVSISPSTKTTGTISISGDVVSGEQPTHAYVTATVPGDTVGSTSMTITGNGNTVCSESCLAMGERLKFVGLVELNSSLQYTYSGSNPTYHRVLGYVV